MRLWSVHPQYLDAVGLVALWREGLLAQAVLAGETKGYTRHPQLERFRAASGLIGQYLACVADEADRRGYAFDRSKIRAGDVKVRVSVTRGQLAFEWEHLCAKLRARNIELYRAAAKIDAPRPHPCFRVVRGGIAEWERQK